MQKKTPKGCKYSNFPWDGLGEVLSQHVPTRFLLPFLKGLKIAPKIEIQIHKKAPKIVNTATFPRTV